MTRAQYLCLFNEGDEAALRLAYALEREAGPALDVIIATAGELSAGQWKHRIDGESVRTEILLPRGPRIDSALVVGGVNRLRFIPPPTMRTAIDAEYAASEVHALALSFLASLAGRWTNPVTSRSLSGGELSWLEWAAIAHFAGLAVRSTTYGTHQRVLAREAGIASAWRSANGSTLLPNEEGQVQKFDNRKPRVVFGELESERFAVTIAGQAIFGRVPETVRRASRQLAERSGYHLLRLLFAQEAGELVLCGIDTHPQELSDDEAVAVADWLLQPEGAEHDLVLRHSL